MTGTERIARVESADEIVRTAEVALAIRNRLEFVIQLLGWAIIPELIVAVFLPLSIGGRIGIGLGILAVNLAVGLSLRSYIDKVVRKRVAAGVRESKVSAAVATRALSELPQFRDTEPGWDMICDLYPLAGHLVRARQIVRKESEYVLEVITHCREATKGLADGPPPAQLECLLWHALCYIAYAEKRKIAWVGTSIVGGDIWNDNCWSAVAQKALEIATDANRIPYGDGSVPDDSRQWFNTIIERARAVISISAEQASSMPGYYVVSTQTGGGGYRVCPEVMGVAQGRGWPPITVRDVVSIAAEIGADGWLLERVRLQWV